MSNQTPEAKKSFKATLLLPILLLGIFLVSSVTVLSSTLLIDIAASFKVSIGTASQLSLINSFVSLVMGFAMGVLTIRFKHRSLFLLGVGTFALEHSVSS